MWCSKEEIRDRKIAAVAGTGYYQQSEKKQERRKLSSAMAMVLGFLVTLEIMVAGAMVLNFDFQTADTLAVVFAFAVLYFGVVAALTDK
ncbi:MAG: hypothetical protein Q4C77_16035 [Eubacteriales bacterium]|nr:hypothetical protein [Eubacteriales bacterium]